MIPVSRDWWLAYVNGGVAANPEFTAGTLGKVVPIIEPYTPALGLTLADLTLATFTGSAPKVQGAEPDLFTDPATGNIVLHLHDPAGGWLFVCAVAPAATETIYGFALTNAAGSILVAVTEPLNDPVEITEVGDGVDAGTLEFQIGLGCVS